MKNFLFAFDFTERTMNDYIIDFLKKNQIDFFYEYPGEIVADLFGIGQYYKLDIDDVVGCRKEVLYNTDKVYTWEGRQRLYPLKEKVVRIGKEPCYTVKVDFENGDSITTQINGTKEKIIEFYMNNIFNLGTVDDNLQRATRVEIIA